MNDLFECPVCKGVGKLSYPESKIKKERKDAVVTLYDNGYGIREIMRLLQYKSPRSVSFILENYSEKYKHRNNI